MGNRQWPYDPYDPRARSRPREDDGGWVVAGEEEQRPPYGQPGSPQRPYGEWPEPRTDRYPAAGQPRPSGYQPPEDAYHGTRGDAYGGAYGGPHRDPYRDSYGGGYNPARQYGDAPTRYGDAAPARPAAGRQPGRPVPPQRQEPDDEPPPPVAATLSWTIAAYLVPMLLYLGWAFTRSGTAPPGCVDASGAACPPPRVEAAENLLDILPAVIGALVLALLIAMGLRRLATGWRAASIGLAAAVIGGGFATFVAAVLG